ncbi:MAG: hypothetical protein AABZ00_05005 [Chloroflexota bacterium]
MKLIVDGKRYDTGKMQQVIDEQRKQGHSNGVTLLGAFLTKDKRVLVVTDSVWESGRNDGTCVGTTGHFADADEIARLADRYGGELEDLVPEGE